MVKEKIISIVVPVYNEEKCLARFYNELKDESIKSGLAYEIIFVDDGSKDSSRLIMADLCKKDKSVKAVIFSRNYGQTAAITAGIECARGDYIITMDADMQNDPRDISALINKAEEGYDLVSGWRKNRKDVFLSRLLPSLIANRLISVITGLKLHDYGCTIKIYKADFLKNVNLYGEMHRFIPIYIYRNGGRVAEIEVNHRKREYGKSKYGINRAFKVVLDLITVNFLLGPSSTSPLYFFGYWGVLLIILGGICGFVTLYEKIFLGIWVHRNPLLLVAIFFILIGAQAIFLGLLAEMNMRIYYEANKKSIYVVRERINA
jgi:glycosyltransferase involved in cell wall biosynthesis